MMSVRTINRNLTLACICLISLASLQCGRGYDRAYFRGSTVAVAYCCGERVLKPSMGVTARFLVFLPLVAYDRNGELEGRLARRWEHSPDYHEWTYHLRTDVRWHDGVPVTAHDIKFSIELLVHPDVLHYPAGTMSITVLDDSTFTVRYSGSPAPDWWTVYYPKHLLEGLDPKDFSDWEFWTQPVGNGPFRYVRHVPRTMMEFEANRDYYRGKPGIERVVLKFVGEAALTELLGGNVDAITDVKPAQIPRLAADPRFRVYHTISGRGVRAIYWQNGHPFFRDPEVRRALTLAINRRELLQVLNLPENIPVVDGPFTHRQLRQGQLPDPLPYDPVLARRLLDEAGWLDVDGDGVRERDGAEFRFTAIVAADPGWQQLAVYAQDQLRRVGVRMDVQALEFGTIRGKLRSGDFEAAFTLSVSIPWLLQLNFGEDSPIGYKNAEVVGLIEEALATEDPDAQDRIYQELMEIFRADLPITSLFPFVGTDVAHRRLHGLSSPWRADPVWYMEDLWLEDED